MESARSNLSLHSIQRPSSRNNEDGLSNAYSSNEHESSLNHTQRTVAVIGLGYVGLPLALLLQQQGFHVHGVDVDEQKINLLKNGKSYIAEIKDSEIQKAVASPVFTLSINYNSISTAEAIIICVPTPLTSYRTPDLGYLTHAVNEISSRLRKGQLVILESSTYPGTTNEIVLSMLQKTGLQVGSDFHLAYSPERVDPGNKDFPLAQITKIISGVTPSCLERVEELYQQIFDHVHPVSSTEAAEMTKLLENAYRLINISFMNEMALLCDALKLNLWEIIEAARTKPFGYTPFYHGPGIGGHCIPIDPSYLQWKVKQYGLSSYFIQIANEINHRMPAYIVQQIKGLLAPKELSSASVLIYGTAYKKDIADYRESPSLELIQLLMTAGAKVQYHDPFVPSIKAGKHSLCSTELSEELVKSVDCVIIATDHSSIPLEFIVQHSSLVYDTRNVTKGLTAKAQVVRLGGGHK